MFFLLTIAPRPGVGRLARCEQLAIAKKAFAAGNRKRHHHTVAALQLRHADADILDDAHELVPEHVAGLHSRNLAAIDVQVRAADRGGGHAQRDIVGLGQHGVGNRFDANVFRSVIAQGFQPRLLGKRSGEMGTVHRGSGKASQVPGPGRQAATHGGSTHRMPPRLSWLEFWMPMEVERAILRQPGDSYRPGTPQPGNHVWASPAWPNCGPHFGFLCKTRRPMRLLPLSAHS